jgi:hypothetical protein
LNKANTHETAPLVQDGENNIDGSVWSYYQRLAGFQEVPRSDAGKIFI